MEKEENNLYLIRKLEESGGYVSRAFSFRYNVWKRNYSISRILSCELKRIADKAVINILDVFLEKLPFSSFSSETLLFEARK